MEQILSYALTLFNMVVLESLLSVDNIAVLAILVGILPKHQQAKALIYGMVGAYLFRGISLLFLGFFIHNPFFAEFAKLIGGLFLVKLSLGGLFGSEEDDVNEVSDSMSQKIMNKFGITQFVAIIIQVELLDFTFSIDNLFAAVAFTENIQGDFLIFGYEISKSMALTIIGVFLGIALMRFVAQGFIKLIEIFPILNKCAFIVVLLLGIKLVLSGFTEYIIEGLYKISFLMKQESFDMYFSATMILVFLGGILFSKFKK